MILAFRFAKRKYRENRDRKRQESSYVLHQDVDVPRRRSDQSQLRDSTSEARPTPQDNNLVASELPAGQDGGSTQKSPETPEEKAAKKRRRVYRTKIIFAMFLPFTLQALDTTMIATALPLIAKEFGGFSFPRQLRLHPPFPLPAPLFMTPTTTTLHHTPNPPHQANTQKQTTLPSLPSSSPPSPSPPPPSRPSSPSSSSPPPSPDTSPSRSPSSSSPSAPPSLPLRPPPPQPASPSCCLAVSSRALVPPASTSPCALSCRTTSRWPNTRARGRSLRCSTAWDGPWVRCWAGC